MLQSPVQCMLKHRKTPLTFYLTLPITQTSVFVNLSYILGSHAMNVKHRLIYFMSFRIHIGFIFMGYNMHMHFQHTFITFVGGKLLGPTVLGSPTVRTVGVRVTFSLLLWKLCWTYRFWLPTTKELQQMGHNYLQHQQMSEKSDQHQHF